MANDNEIEFTVRIKDDGLGQVAENLGKVEDGAQGLGAAATAAGAGVDKLGDAADQAGAELGALADEQGKAQSQGTELGESAGAAAQDVAGMGQAAAQAGTGLQELATAEDKAEQQAGELGTGVQAVAKDVAEVGKAADQAGSGLDKLGDAADQTGADLGKLAATEDKAQKAVAELGDSAEAAGKGVAEMGRNAQQAEGGIDKLATTEDKAEQQARELGAGAQAAAKGVAEVGKSAEQVSSELGALAQAVDAKTKAIKTGLQVEQSEIELQRQHLVAAQAEQQARLQAAQARGDEAAATRAQNALRQIESDKLALVARAKRAEAAAVEQAAAARREELAAVGPLNAAHAKELQAAENYAKALRVEAAAADQAAQRARELGTAHKSAASGADQLSGRVGNLTQLLGQMAGALGAAFTFRELVTAAAQMEQLRSGLTAVTGDATKAGQELEFVRKVAARIGADVTEVGKAFLGLSAATRGTAVEGEHTRQVFEAVATAMGKAGKSSAETANALQALSQMASKGVVQSEELRGQLGEALPGALSAAAKGMGITTAELMKLVEEGKIAASDLFPALAKGLNDLYGGAPAAQTLSQEITNIKNSVTDMATNIGDAGGLTALKTGAEIAQAAIVGLDAGIVAAGKSIGTVIAAVVSRDFSGLKQAFSDIEKEAKDKILKAAQHNETLRNSLKASGDEAVIAALAQQELAAETAKASAAAAAGANDFVKLQNGYKLVLTSVREQIAEQEKSVIARDAEGKASVTLAAAFGTEAEQRNAQTAAAASSAVELEKLAKLKLTELDTMQEELKSLKAETEQMAVVDEAKKEQMAKLERLIALRQQDADKAVAQAQAGRLAAESAQAEAEALKDNSGRVRELAEAYEQARTKLEQVRAAKAAGKATTEELTAAEIAAGRAAALYRDALQDQLQAIQAKASAQQSSIGLEQAGVRLAIEQQKAIFEVARARGDERTAMQAQNEIRRLEIQLLELTAQAKRAEAQAALAAIEVKRAELVATGQLTDAKRLELDAARNAARAKEVEAQISEVTAQKMRNLASAHADAARGARDHASATNESADALDRLSDASERFKSRSTRFVGTLQSDTNQAIAKRYGDDMVGNAKAEEAWRRRLELENYQKSYGNVQRSQESLNQERNIRSELERLEREIEQEKQGKQANKIPVKESATTSTSTQPSGGIGATYISNITIPGVGSASPKFADSGSQSQTEDLFRKLAQAKGASI